MKKEFKGTQGKWCFNEKYQTIEDSQGYGIAQQNGITNSENWIKDALLVSKAPELLYMLIELRQIFDKYSVDFESEFFKYKEPIEKLIKEATQI